MSNNAINQSASILANNGAAYQQANNNIFNAISQAADMWQQMQMKKQASLDAMRMKQADILTDPEKASQMILTKAYQLGPENLTPADKAAFEAAQRVLAAKVAIQPQTGQAYNPYQPIDLNGIAGPTGIKVQNPAADMFAPPAVQSEILPPRVDGKMGTADQFNKDMLPAPSVLGKAPEKVVKDTSAVLSSPAAQMEQVKTDIGVQGNIATEEAKSRIEEQRKQREDEFKLKQDLRVARPKVDATFSGMVDDYNNISNKADKTKGQVHWYNTGIFENASALTGGNDLAANLKTIQADSAFGSLQQMRNNSPTGGALGSVSERELSFLQNAKTNLEQSQNPDQLKDNVDEYKRIRASAIKNTAEAYKKDYGEYPKGYDPRKFEAIVSAVNVPKGAIEHLKDNPKLSAQFDAKYGKGMAAKVLGK